MDNSIVTVLTAYRRPYYLERQIEHIRNQSIESSEIWLWVNSHEDNYGFDFSNFGLDNIFHSSNNLKFYPRFAISLLAESNYVAIFDDDTMPGRDWFKNCLDTMKTHEGILGGVGVLLNDNDYTSSVYHGGWWEKNNEVVEVDLVGHAWFFKREWLNYLWREPIPLFDNGEDIQFSYLAQKYGGIKTYCPAHPENNIELFSSLYPFQLGDDEKASYKVNRKVHAYQRNDCVSQAIDNGWRPLFMR